MPAAYASTAESAKSTARAAKLSREIPSGFQCDRSNNIGCIGFFGWGPGVL
jgi:hypothetical protein